MLSQLDQIQKDKEEETRYENLKFELENTENNFRDLVFEFNEFKKRNTAFLSSSMRKLSPSKDSSEGVDAQTMGRNRARVTEDNELISEAYEQMDQISEREENIQQIKVKMREINQDSKKMKEVRLTRSSVTKATG